MAAQWRVWMNLKGTKRDEVLAGARRLPAPVRMRKERETRVTGTQKAREDTGKARPPAG